MHANACNLGLNIKSQEDVVLKAEKAYNNAVEADTALQDQEERLDKKVAGNNNEQLLKQQAFNEERLKLRLIQMSK